MGSNQTKEVNHDTNKMKKKYIVLDENNNDTNSVFTGSKPSCVAKKLATRGYKIIRIREKNTKRIHLYKGSYYLKDRKKHDPKWLPTRYKCAIIKKVQILLDPDEYKKMTRSGKKY